jgi:hypothetical protein
MGVVMDAKSVVRWFGKSVSKRRVGRGPWSTDRGLFGSAEVLPLVFTMPTALVYHDPTLFSSPTATPTNIVIQYGS